MATIELGVRQMARELGRSPALVVRYRDRGMPMDSVAGARHWIAANVQATARALRDGAGAAPPAGDAPLAPMPEDYHDARTRREAAEADLAELALAEKRGELVRAADVRAAHARRLAALRESLLQLPARLAAVLAAEPSQARCHDILQAELHAALEQLAGTA